MMEGWQFKEGPRRSPMEKLTPEERKYLGRQVCEQDHVDIQGKIIAMRPDLKATGAFMVEQ